MGAVTRYIGRRLAIAVPLLWIVSVLSYLLLYRAADPVARPVVGALCFGLRKAGNDPALQACTFECFPTIYEWEEHGDQVGFRVIPDYPEDTLMEVGATGAACFVVH